MWVKRIINRVNKMIHSVALWLYEDDFDLFRKGVLFLKPLLRNKKLNLYLHSLSGRLAQLVQSVPYPPVGGSGGS